MGKIKLLDIGKLMWWRSQLKV